LNKRNNPNRWIIGAQAIDLTSDEKAEAAKLAEHNFAILD